MQYCSAHGKALTKQRKAILTIITEETTNEDTIREDSFVFQVDEIDNDQLTACEIAHDIGIHKAPMSVATIVYASRRSIL